MQKNNLSEIFERLKSENDVIVGFGDIDKTGYLDRLFVHKDYQNQDIATVICNELEKAFDVSDLELSDL